MVQTKKVSLNMRKQAHGCAKVRRNHTSTRALSGLRPLQACTLPVPHAGTSPPALAQRVAPFFDVDMLLSAAVVHVRSALTGTLYRTSRGRGSFR